MSALCHSSDLERMGAREYQPCTGQGMVLSYSPDLLPGF